MVVIRFYQHSLLSKESFENKSAFMFPIRATLSFTSLSEQPKTIEKGWRSIRNGFVEEKHCQRHTGPRGWVECSHQSNCCYHKFYTKFCQNSASRCRPNFNFNLLKWKSRSRSSPTELQSINFQRREARGGRYYRKNYRQAIHQHFYNLSVNYRYQKK